MTERLFDMPPEWAARWRDMPEFIQADERANGGSLTVYFRDDEDRRAFLKLVGYGPWRQAGIWYPPKTHPRDAYDQDFEPSKVARNRYPIYIVSKGRWSRDVVKSVKWTSLTYLALDKLGIDYSIVVEPQEAESYAEHVDVERILVLPFSELGQGSIPARNWIWDHAVENGANRHWVLDDNIENFARINHNRNRIIKDENPFVACEDFVDRYRNIGLAGLNYREFADAKNPNLPPYRLNTRIYSCILVNHALPFRWRGRYNEDTDLALRVLKDGWVTVLLNCYLIDKIRTMSMNGGNMDELYNGNGRGEMAESLRRQHPDVVSVTEKWGRPQHHVDYSPFKDNKLIPR